MFCPIKRAEVNTSNEFHIVYATYVKTVEGRPADATFFVCVGVEQNVGYLSRVIYIIDRY